MAIAAQVTQLLAMAKLKLVAAAACAILAIGAVVWLTARPENSANAAATPTTRRHRHATRRSRRCG